MTQQALIQNAAPTPPDPDVARIVAGHLARILGREPPDVDTIDPDAGLFEHYGLTSLNMVILMTSVCEDTGTPMFAFTETDIARLRTPRDVVDLIASARRSSDKGGQAT